MNYFVTFCFLDFSELGYRSRAKDWISEFDGPVLWSLAVELEGPFGRYSAISSQHRSVRTKSGVNVVTMMDLDLLEVFMFFDFSVFEFR